MLWGMGLYFGWGCIAQEPKIDFESRKRQVRTTIILPFLDIYLMEGCLSTKSYSYGVFFLKKKKQNGFYFNQIRSNYV